MKRVSMLIAPSMLAILCLNAHAQNAPAKWADTVSREIDRAYVSGDPAKVQAARAVAERVATAFPRDGLILHYEGFALYREGTVLASRGTDAAPIFQRAKDILERSLKLHPLPETHAVISSIEGQLIAKDPSRGMELGMAASASIAAALALGPNNPRVWLIRGLSAIYTPAEYGGGLQLAEEQIKKSIELFAKDAPKPGEPSWGNAEAHIWLGQVYQQLKDNARAAVEYNAALEIEPEFAWAKALAGSLK
jgi:tetratricopeptide (TPR) repeat protein